LLIISNCQGISIEGRRPTHDYGAVGQIVPTAENHDGAEEAES